MAKSALMVPFPSFNNSDGNPLNSGSIFIGTAQLDPEKNLINAFFDKDLTISAAQPIRTRNGFPINQNGAPTHIYVDSDNYSITVKDKNNLIVF